MRVRVLKAATYGPRYAQHREVGEEFETPTWYAHDLVKSGFVEIASEKPPEPDLTQNPPESGENAPETLSESVSEPESAQEASFSASSPLLDILSIRQAAALAAAGYDSPGALNCAGDDDLEAVLGIGPATVRKIRAWLAEEQ